MFVIIENVLDGSWDSVDLIGAYEDKEQAKMAMWERVAKVSSDYAEWRGGEFYEEYTCCTDDFASVGYEGEGECIRWFVFDTDNPTTSYNA